MQSWKVVFLIAPKNFKDFNVWHTNKVMLITLYQKKWAEGNHKNPSALTLRLKMK